MTINFFNQKIMKISPLFAWYDLWIGVFWDQKKRWLYILPIPCLGVVLKFPEKEEKPDTQKCSRPGCENKAMKCEIPGGYDHDTQSEYPESYEYHCPEHAREAGFCAGCGTFIAGWKDFSDYCDNCEDEIYEAFDEEDENYYYDESEFYG